MDGVIGRNDPCWCGSGLKWKKCHAPLLGPAKTDLREQYRRQYGIILKTPAQIEGIRRACRLAATVLQETLQLATAGTPTLALNDFAAKRIAEANATAAALHYGSPPYPRSICISLNDVICHGIADEKPLEEGDILNIDVAVVLEGYYGDCSAMAMVGEVSQERRLVVEVSRKCLQRAIAVCKPGILVSVIGKAIEEYAESQGCTVVHDFVAHGVGLHFHEPPQIPHCRNRVTIPLAAGMTFTIEPMINAGVAESVVDPHDHWTARTADGRASAQWEHTILITEGGHEVLTVPGPIGV
jgi:methionyl aminopeptidase